MDAGSVQPLRDREARPEAQHDARERRPRRRPAPSTASGASDGDDAAAVIPAAPVGRKLDVIA